MYAADPLVVLNAMMAESLDFAATFLEDELRKGAANLGEAVQKFIEHVMEEDGAVIFNGNGYSEIWQSEAVRRGLPNYPATPDAVQVYLQDPVIDMCEKYHIFSRQELKARHDIQLSQYIKTVHTECSLAIRMARTQVYPAAVRYRQELASSISACANLDVPAEKTSLTELSGMIQSFEDSLRALEACEHDLDWFPEEDHLAASARACIERIIPALEELRRWADSLETVVAEDLWPLPSYQEILFMK
jgi:glutamine synthetase